MGAHVQMPTRGTEDSEDPISQSTASSEDLLPASEPRGPASSEEPSCPHERKPATVSTAARAQQRADEEEHLDDLLELLQDSDDDEPSATSASTQQNTDPPPKRARRLPGWMASAARPPPPAPRPAAVTTTRSTRGAPNVPSGASSSVASRQMERAFEQEQAQKRRKLEDAKASTVPNTTGGSDGVMPRLLGALVDQGATAASTAKQPGLTMLTRALFPRRIVVFDVETTGFAQDDVIVEIGGVELVDGVRTVSCTPSAIRSPIGSTTC